MKDRKLELSDLKEGDVLYEKEALTDENEGWSFERGKYVGLSSEPDNYIWIERADGLHGKAADYWIFPIRLIHKLGI